MAKRASSKSFQPAFALNLIHTGNSKKSTWCKYGSTPYCLGSRKTPIFQVFCLIHLNKSLPPSGDDRVRPPLWKIDPCGCLKRHILGWAPGPGSAPGAGTWDIRPGSGGRELNWKTKSARTGPEALRDWITS